MNPNPTPANPAQPTPAPEMKPETKRSLWHRFWDFMTWEGLDYKMPPTSASRSAPSRATCAACGCQVIDRVTRSFSCGGGYPILPRECDCLPLSGIPPTRVHVEMPPVKPPRRPDAVHGETFMRYEDGSVINETKPFYVGRQPKPLKPAPGPAAAYVVLYPELVRVAREHGYALAPNGSVARDFDLVAVPWIQEASDALTLIKALKAATGGVTTNLEFDDLMPNCSPNQKPHGRVAYSIYFTEQGAKGPYLDISVMPRVGSNLPDDESMMG